LGLTRCREVAERHGDRIWAVSEKESDTFTNQSYKTMLKIRRKFKSRCKTIRWSILQNFTILIFLTALAFFIAFVAVMYIQSTIIFSNVIHKVVSDLENDLKKFFNPVSTSLVVVSKFAGLNMIEQVDREQINSVLIPIFTEYPQINAARLSDSNGTGYLVFKSDKYWISRSITASGSVNPVKEARWDTDLNLLEEKSLDKNPDLRASEWFRSAKNNTDDKLAWTDPYISELNKQLVITVSTQVVRADGKQVVLAFDISLKNMPGIAKYSRWEKSGIAFVMTENRKIIGLTGTKLLRGDTPNDLVIIPLSEVDIPMLHDAIKFWEKPRRRHRIGHSDDQLLFFGSKGERSAGTVQPFHLSQSKALWIGYIMPTANVRYFKQYFNQLLIIPIVFCLALLVAFLLTKKMARTYITPLTKLAQQSTRISCMDLKPGELITSDITELQQLADSHEVMRAALEATTTDLRISNEKLEEFSRTLTEKVDERTLELQEKSYELEELNRTLEIKVKHEVEASSKKDQIMLQSARQAQMGEMISMIAHQWRQPLSSISTVTGNMLVFLELDNFEKNQFKELLNSINNHAQYLSRTINDFRNFFKPNKDKQSVQLESVLEQTINIIGKSLSYKNIKLQTDYQFETPLNTYPNELTQVFLNIIKNGQDVLLENQIEYPVIEIAGRNEGESQIVEISDNAGGIPLEIMDKIFEPYFSTKGEKTGTGLGLYMSKLIIEKHCKGTLEVENTDNGALFTIRLPLES